MIKGMRNLFLIRRVFGSERLPSFFSFPNFLILQTAAIIAAAAVPARSSLGKMFRRRPLPAIGQCPSTTSVFYFVNIYRIFHRRQDGIMRPKHARPEHVKKYGCLHCRLIIPAKLNFN